MIKQGCTKYVLYYVIIYIRSTEQSTAITYPKSLTTIQTIIKNCTFTILNKEH